MAWGRESKGKDNEQRRKSLRRRIRLRKCVSEQKGKGNGEGGKKKIN